jgi:hypothetical protein
MPTDDPRLATVRQFLADYDSDMRADQRGEDATWASHEDGARELLKRLDGGEATRPPGVSDDFHTVPIDDLIEHVTDGGDCPCGPDTVPIERDDGSIVYQYIHHSLDGREHDEEGHDKVACPGCRADLAVVSIRPAGSGFEVIKRGHRRWTPAQSMPDAQKVARRLIRDAGGEGLLQQLNAAGKVVREDIYSCEPL